MSKATEKSAAPATDTTSAAAPATDTASAAAPAAATAPTFDKARLRKDCLKLFGVTSSTFDGATAGLDGKYSVGEIRKHIKKWSETAVKGVK